MRRRLRRWRRWRRWRSGGGAEGGAGVACGAADAPSPVAGPPQEDGKGFLDVAVARGEGGRRCVVRKAHLHNLADFGRQIAAVLDGAAQAPV